MTQAPAAASDRQDPVRAQLCERCGGPGAGCRTHLLGLYDYWAARCRGRTFPARGDIEPLDLPALLPNLFLVDVLPGAPRFRYRLAGSRVDQIAGRSMTGHTTDDIATPELAQRVNASYLAVLSERRPRCDRVQILAENGGYWHYERILLPLSDDGDTINMLLGAIYET